MPTRQGAPRDAYASGGASSEQITPPHRNLKWEHEDGPEFGSESRQAEASASLQAAAPGGKNDSTP